MGNEYNIPDWLEQKIRKRDTHCVYCNVKLRDYYVGKGKDKATIEHMNNNGPFDKEWNIAMCCNSCNSSKGSEKLLDWFKRRGIDKNNVSPVIKKWIKLNS